MGEADRTRTPGAAPTLTPIPTRLTGDLVGTLVVDHNCLLDRYALVNSCYTVLHG
jgi:hypothetical protein